MLEVFIMKMCKNNNFAMSFYLLQMCLSVLSSETYFVTPNSSISCPKGPCQTLAQYATQSFSDSSNITMVFLEGEHILSHTFSLHSLNSLTIKSIDPSVNMTISCLGEGRLVLHDIHNVLLSNVTLVSCEESTVELVDCFAIEQSLVQSLSRAHFYLNGINQLLVIDSTFTFNVTKGVGCVFKICDTSMTLKHSIFKQNSVESDHDLGSILCAFNSSITMQASSFTDNQAPTGGIVYADNSTVTVRECTFTNNHATICGGVAYISQKSHFTIDSCNFTENNSSTDGGVMCVTRDSVVEVELTIFAYNSACRDILPGGNGGVIQLSNNSQCKLKNCTFISNEANEGGVICASNGTSVIIMKSYFIGNRAISSHYGYGNSAVVNAENNVSIIFTQSTFKNNFATTSGGCAQILNSSLSISESCLFENNSAVYGGVFSIWTSSIAINSEQMYTSEDHACDDESSVRFIANSAQHGGALNLIQDTTAHIYCSQFESNNADQRGGAVLVRTNTTVKLMDTKFQNNLAIERGGALFAQFCSIKSSGHFHVESNKGGLGVVYISSCNISFTGDTMFINNTGSFLAQNSDISFSGETFFQNDTSNSTETGGALTVVRSSIAFYDKLQLQENSGANGGAVLAVESDIINYGHCMFSRNSAEKGGAVSAYKSRVKFRGNVTLEANTATSHGGGIYAISSTIQLYSHTSSFSENSAIHGGAVYFDQISRLYIVKEIMECTFDVWYCIHDHEEWLTLSFVNNFASEKGGALYVNDKDSSSCSSQFGVNKSGNSIYKACFIQSVAVYVSANDWNLTETNYANINFMNNTAPEGPLLYGGLLDRCVIDESAEVSRTKGPMTPISYLAYLSRTNFSYNSIASDPVRVCFCANDAIICDKKSETIKTRRGKPFTLSLVAVNQVQTPVSGIVMAYLSSQSSRLERDQSQQKTNGTCTELQYTVFTAKSETLSLYASGPCTNEGMSKVEINVDIDSGCPVGFKLSDSSLECECDPDILAYTSNCSIDTESVERQGRFWISGTFNGNDTDIIVHDYCPHDYCYPPTTPVLINLTDYKNGSDAQCAFHRSGILCGSCEDGYSLTLGSSRCQKCSNYWLLLIIPFGLAGVSLVVMMMVCNLTLASGTLSGLIFYANIVIANYTTYFPFQRQNVLTVFVSWLGLNLGIATCFYNGMDGFGKMWVQLSFEFYLIILVVLVVLLGKSVKISNFFHRHNLKPVHTLATLIMLSYEKLGRRIFSLVSYTRLAYPNGTNDTVWLFDPNLSLLKGKHISLVIVAFFILVTGIFFNLILLFGKVLIAKSKSVYFNNFMEAFYAPFKPHHQYWAGLLLLIRNISYFTSEFLNAGGNPSYNLHVIFTLVSGILLIKLIYVSTSNLKIRIRSGRIRLNNVHDDDIPNLRELDEFKNHPTNIIHQECGIVYKNPYIDLLESSFLLNLSIFTYFTLYLNYENKGQDILFYVSSSVVLLTFVGIFTYHSIPILYGGFTSIFKKSQKTKTTDKSQIGGDYGSTCRVTPTLSEISSLN